MRVNDADGAVAGLAASQHGVVTRVQAAGCGLTPKMIRARKAVGQLREPYPGVIEVGPATASWHTDLMAGVLAGGPEAVVSHRPAARLHGLDGFDDEIVELSVAGARHPRLPGVEIHRVATLAVCDRLVVRGIPVTGLARTLADLGSVAPDRVEQALDDVRRRGTSLGWLRQTAERLHRPGQAGTGVLLGLLDRIEPEQRVRGSWFEALVERCIASPLLSDLVRQHEVHADDGSLIGILDLASPGIRLGIEAHSRRHHYGSREAFDEDRDLKLATVTWEVLYVGWQGTRRPAELLTIVEAVARGRMKLFMGVP